MIKNSCLSLLFLFSFIVYSQDSLLDELDNNSPTEQVDNEKVLNTFGSLRVINIQSTETMSAKSLMFLIQHRFGEVGTGFKTLFGLDGANIRLSLAYGITDNLTIELGRDKFNTTYDGIVKWRFLEQSTSMPVTVAATGSIAYIDTSELIYEKESRRISYTTQLLIARKFKDILSVELMPGIIHRNYVRSTDYDNTTFHLGFAARVKVTKTIYLLGDYVHLFNDKDSSLVNPLGLGMEIITGGGHAFQLHFTNAEALHENGFIRSTTTDFTGDTMRFGFNISRIFWF